MGMGKWPPGAKPPSEWTKRWEDVPFGPGQPTPAQRAAAQQQQRQQPLTPQQQQQQQAQALRDRMQRWAQWLADHPVVYDNNGNRRNYQADEPADWFQ